MTDYRFYAALVDVSDRGNRHAAIALVMKLLEVVQQAEQERLDRISLDFPGDHILGIAESFIGNISCALESLTKCF